MARREIEAILRLRDDLSAQIKRADKNLRDLNKQVEKQRKSLDQVGKNTSFLRLAGTIISAQAAMMVFSKGFRELREFISGSVRASAEFNDAFTKSTAIMGELSNAMKTKMVAAAEEVAKTTTFSAKQGAEAYFFLASAGLDAAQSIGAMGTVSKFAQAGAFDLARATDLLTDAQSALGMTIRDDVTKNMENMNRVSDVLVRANTLANASVEQFSESLTTKAGAAIKILGKDIEEGVAVLAAFADQGVKGADAGTALNIVLRDLSTKAIVNKEAFKDNRIAVFDAAGEMRNLADIISDLEKRLEGMSDEQSKATLRQLGFADKSVIFIQTLIGMSEQIRRYEEELRRAGGTTEDVANKQLKSFAAQAKLTQQAWELLQKALGDFIGESGAVREVFSAIRSFLNDLKESLETNKEAWIKFVSEGIIIAIEALRLFVKTIELVNRDLAKQISIFGKMTKIAGLVTMQHGLRELGREAEDFAADMAEIGMGAGEIAESLKKLQDRITDATGKQLGAIAAQEMYAKSFDGVRESVEELGVGAVAVFDNLAKSGIPAAQAFEMVQSAIEKTEIDDLVKNLETGERAIFETLIKAGYSASEALKMIPKAMEDAADDIDDLADNIADSIGTINDAIIGNLPNVATWGKTLLTAVQEAEQGFIAMGRNPLVEKWAEWMKPAPIPSLRDIEIPANMEKLSEPIERYITALEDAANMTIVFGDNLTRVFAGVGSAIGGFQAMFTKEGGGFGLSGFTDLFKTEAGAAGKTTFGSFVGGLASAIPLIGSIVGPAIQLLSKLFKPGWKKLAEEGARVFGKELSEGLSKELLKVSKQLGSIQNAFAARIGDIVAEVGVTAENVGEIFKHLNYLIGMVENGTLDWKDAVEQVDKAFGPLVEQLQKMGIEGSFQIGQLISRMRELGHVSGEVQSFIEEKAKSAISELSKYFDYLIKQQDLTADHAKAALAYMAGAFQAAVMSAGSLVGAIAMLGDSFGQLLERFRALLGDQNAVLNVLTQYYNFVKANEEQLSALAALSEGFKALAELGIINRNNIDEFAAAFKHQFDEILAKTEDQNTALAAMGPQIAQLMEAYRALGLQVPEWLADLAAKAKEAGASLEPPKGALVIWKEIRDILYSIAEAFGVAAREASDFGRAAGEAAREAGRIGGPRGAGIEEPRGFQYGGYVSASPPYGRLIRVGEREGEYIIPKSKMGGGERMPVAAGGEVHIDKIEINVHDATNPEVTVQYIVRDLGKSMSRIFRRAEERGYF